MLPDIRPDHLEMVRDILRRHVPQYAVWAFGSRAKWTAKDYSDLDLCIRSDKALDFRTLGALIEDFSESDLPYKVDIVDWATTSESFRKIIEQDKVLIQDKEKKTGMSSEWLCTTIGEQLTLQRGFDITKATQQPGKVPVISSGRTNSHHSTAAVKGPGVVLGRKGVVGSVYFVREDYWPHDTTLWIKDFHGNDELFAYYFFLAKAKDLARLDVGSANPTLNRNHVHPIKVQWPSVAEQKLIGQMLAALDDRITLLHETNATLEAIAQALFKSWFVDFDPVRAKHEGRAPEGMDAATTELFPDSFEESELGLVPRGWNIHLVEEVTEKVGMGPFGSNIKVETFVEQGIPVISGQHLHHTLMEDLSFNFISEKHAEKLKSSCVFAGDVVFTHAGNIGQVSLIHSDTHFDKYVLSQRQFFLRCDVKKILPVWATYFFRSPQGQHLLLANSSQVGVPSISRPVSYLRSIKLVVPPITLLLRFTEIVDLLHKGLIANRGRIKTLAALRDTLLPRLISGQLRLPEAASLLEQAAA